MKNLLCIRELLETVIKDSNKLKAKKRLDSRKDHSGFFDYRPSFFFEARRPGRGVLVFRWHPGCLVGHFLSHTWPIRISRSTVKIFSGVGYNV